MPYCPEIEIEIEIGLGTPREAIRLTADGRLVNRGGTADHTAAMAALPLPAGLDGYVFKAKSPSCGLHTIARYRPDGVAADHDGRGRYAGRVLDRFPLGSPVGPRLGGSWEPRQLVGFHASGGGWPWLAAQTYLKPFPAGLGLRHSL